MTTQNKSSKAKATTKKSTSSITDKELGNILTETLNKVAETEPKATQPQPVRIDGRDKTAFMVVMLKPSDGKKTPYAARCQSMLKRPAEP